MQADFKKLCGATGGETGFIEGKLSLYLLVLMA
jgi:hypothetical protein